MTVLTDEGAAFESKEEKRKFEQKAVKKIANAMKHSYRRRSPEFFGVEAVPTARVPIVRAKYAAPPDQTGGRRVLISCDISVENRLAVQNTALIRAYIQLDDRFAAVARVLKLWGKSRGVLGGTAGALTTYALNLMLLFFLQVRRPDPVLPCLQAGIPAAVERLMITGFDCTVHPAETLQWRSGCTASCGTLVTEFFAFYGQRFGRPLAPPPAPEVPQARAAAGAAGATGAAASASGGASGVSGGSAGEGSAAGAVRPGHAALMELLAGLLAAQPEIGAKKAHAAVQAAGPQWARILPKAVRTALAEAKATARAASSGGGAGDGEGGGGGPELPAVVCPRLGRELSREEKGWVETKWLHIEDPFETSHNVADVLMKKNERRVYNEIKRAAEMLANGATLRAVM